MCPLLCYAELIPNLREGKACIAKPHYIFVEGKCSTSVLLSHVSSLSGLAIRNQQDWTPLKLVAYVQMFVCETGCYILLIRLSQTGYTQLVNECVDASWVAQPIR